MPTLQQIRYLVALAETLHFRRAAEACHVTQPTLSAQLRQLEARLGVRLVEQVRPSVILTPIGRAVAERGRGLLREVEEIRDLAKSGRSPDLEAIRMGVATTLGSYLLPVLVPELRLAKPDLSLASREDAPDALLEGLDQGVLDLLVVPLPTFGAGLAERPFFREPILVVLPREHPLAAAPDIEPGDLAGEIVLGPGVGQVLHEPMRLICERTGARLLSDHQGTNLDGLRQMVARGMGMSLMPALYVRSEVAREDRVVARPFRGEAPTRLIGLVWRRQAARASDYHALADLMTELLRQQVPEVDVIP